MQQELAQLEMMDEEGLTMAIVFMELEQLSLRANRPLMCHLTYTMLLVSGPLKSISKPRRDQHGLNSPHVSPKFGDESGESANSKHHHQRQRHCYDSPPYRPDKHTWPQPTPCPLRPELSNDTLVSS